MTELAAVSVVWLMFLAHVALPGAPAGVWAWSRRRGRRTDRMHPVHSLLIGSVLGLAVFGASITPVSVSAAAANQPPTSLRWSSGWIEVSAPASGIERDDARRLVLWGRAKDVDDADEPTGPRHLLVTSDGSPVHLLGTDQLGRDLLTISLRGFRLTLLNGLIVTVLTYSIALVLGGVAGLLRRRLSGAILFVGDVLMCMPSVVIVLTVWIGLRATKVASDQNTYLLAMCAMSLVTWPWMARMVRNLVSLIRKLLFVEQARGFGARTPWILFRHVLPHTLSFVLVAASIKLPHFMLAEAGLSLIGISPGFDPFGRVVIDNLKDWSLLSYYPWRIFPALLLVGAVVYSATLGDLFRDGSDRATLDRGTKRTPRQSRTSSPSPRRPDPAESRGQLAVDGLTVHADDAPLLGGVSFRLRRGELLLIVGPTGVGKSTLMTSTVALLPPGLSADGGWLSIDGRQWDLSRYDGKGVRGRQIAYVFQEPGVALNPHRTVGVQVAEPARLLCRLSRLEARDRSARLLKRVGIRDPERVLNAFPRQLSGGELHRVGLAAALSGEPSYLLADEPLGALDSVTRKELLGVLRDLCREGLGVALVSHDPQVVAPYADRCIEVLPGGPVVERDLARFRSPSAVVAEGPTASASSTAAVVLQTRALRFSVEGNRILDDVHVSLGPGEMIFLAGRSGCGKTTLLLLLSGRLGGYQGEVLRNGSGRPVFGRDLQMIHQDYRASMNPRWTVEEIVSEPLRIAKRHRRTVREGVLSAIEKVNLEPALLSRLPGELSGGQRQRVAIARALVCDPKVLLADEPVGAVHARLRREILGLLRRLTRESQVSCIVATHDLRDTFLVSDRGYILAGGRVVDEGRPDEILRSDVPETRELLAAADLISAPDSAARPVEEE